MDQEREVIRLQEANAHLQRAADVAAAKLEEGLLAAKAKNIRSGMAVSALLRAIDAEAKVRGDHVFVQSTGTECGCGSCTAARIKAS